MKGSKALKFNLWVVGLTFVAQVFLACTPFIPKTAGFWHANSPQDFYNSLAGFLGIQLLLLSTAVTVIVAKGVQDQEGGLSEIRSALPLTIVKRLTDSEFYSHFRSAVEEAEHSVRIAYLAPYPPSDVKYEDRRKYYQEILGLMKKRTKINFKRLVRASPKNEVWVADLIRELTGKPNVELSLLTRDLPADLEMPLALSVQVIDGEKAWLVAVGGHETERDFRDVYIENQYVAGVLSDYYERVWQVSEKLLDHGRVTREGSDLLQRVSAGQ